MQDKKGLRLLPYILLVAVLVFEILPLVYYNLFPKTMFMDQDYAKIVRHIIEIGDRRQIFLPNWDYLTTGEFDCAAPIALLIYMITGNIYVGFGIANIVNMALWGYIVFRLLGIAGVDVKFRMLAYAIVLLPYDFGMLAYTNMMFFCGGQYVYKTMVPVLFTLALVIPAKEWKKPGNLFVYVLLFFLSFLTALSGGLYVLMCGIAPIVVCYIISLISNKNKDDIGYKAIIAGIVVIMALIGRKLCVMVGVDPASSSLEIRKSFDYIGVFNSVANYLFQLFNPFPSKGISPTSIEGISLCAKWVIIFVILLGLSFIPRAFGIYLCKDTEEEADTRSLVSSFLISVFVWNFAIMFMTMSSPRYHLIGLLPLIMVSIIALDDFWKRCNDVIKNILPLMLGLLIVIITYNSTNMLRDGYYTGGDGYYGVTMEQFAEFIDYLDENDIGTVFFADNSELPEFLRAIDTKRAYETYMSGDGSVINYDFYVSERDRAAYTDRNVILVKEESLENLPEYILDNYKKVYTFSDFEVLFSETNPIDGIVMIDSGLRTIDLATTPEYKYVGEIDGSGYMHTSEIGKVLESPVLRVNEPFTFKVNYSAPAGSSAIVKFHEFDDYYGRDEGVVYELDPDKTEIEVTADKPGNYLIVVENQGEQEIIIKEIEFNGT